MKLIYIKEYKCILIIFFAYFTNAYTVIFQCEVKVKNASGETKSKRLLEQKINSLEEKLKKSTKSVENLEAKLKAMKTSLNEKEKEVENLEVSLDKALCEKQEIECRYEAKDQALKSYQSSTATTLKTLQKELESTQEEFQKTKVDHEQHVLQLQEELDKARESLNSSISAHERHLQETTKALHEEHDTTLAECQVSIFYNTESYLFRNMYLLSEFVSFRLGST